MSRRTRKTFQGMKTRFRKSRVKHSPIRRIVGTTPMQSLSDAASETARNVSAEDMTDEQFDAVVAYAKPIYE